MKTSILFILISFLVVISSLAVARDGVVLNANSINLRDVKDVTLKYESKPGDTEDVYIVTSKEFFKTVVNWKRGFSIYELSDTKGWKRDIIVISLWKNPERDSSHYTIEKALGALPQIKTMNLVRIEKGYIQPANGGFEVYDLAGTSIYRNIGNGERDLSSSAQTVRSAFSRLIKISIDFPETDPNDSGYSGGYGPR